MSYVIIPATDRHLANIGNVGDLGNRKKIRKKRRLAHAYMGAAQIKYNAKEAEVKKLLQEAKDKVDVVSGLSKQLQIAGYSYEQIKAIAG